MLRSVLIVPAITVLIFCLAAPAVIAQSKNDGIRVFEEAMALHKKAQTSADLQQVVQKYQQALKIFERVGLKDGIGVASNNLGLIYAGWGQYDKAMEYYEKSLAIDRQIKDRKGEGRTLNNMGNVYRELGQYDKAKECYQKSLAINREVKDKSGEGTSLNNLGLVFAHWGQYEMAKDYYEKAMAISRGIKDRKGEVDSLNNLGLVFRDWGQYDKAREYFEKVLAIRRQLKDGMGEGHTLNNLGLVFMDWGQYDKAKEYYEKAMAIFRELRDRKDEGIALNNLGLVFKDWGQYDKAKEYYEKSLAIRRELKDRSGEGQTVNNLGCVFREWGQYDKALENHEKALAIARELKDRTREGMFLNNVGLLFKDMGQYDKVVEYYEKSLAISRGLKDRKQEAMTLNNLGVVFMDWGQYDKAVEYYEKSLAITRQLKDRRGEGETLNSLGLVFAGWGQYDKAVEYYEKSLSIRRDLKDRKGEGETLNNLGLVFQQRGDWQTALGNFQKGLAIWTEIEVPTEEPKKLIGMLYLEQGDMTKAEPFIKEAGAGESAGRLFLLKKEYTKAKESYDNILKSAEKNRKADDFFIAHTGLGFVWEEMGDNPKAAEHYSKAVDCTEDLRASLSAGARESFFDVKVAGFSRTDPYKGLARALAKMNRPVEALKQSEGCRARVFAETLSRRSSGVSLDIPKDVMDKDSLLNNQLAALTKNLQTAYEKGNKLAIGALEPQVKELKGKLSAHVGTLRKQYPLFAATKYPQPMGLEQTALRDDEWVLAYDVTDSGVLIYLTRGKNLVKGLFKTIPQKELEELVTKFRQPMEMTEEGITAKQLAKFDFTAGKKLSDLLLADILPELPKAASLIVVPDGSLGVVPFEMLVLNDGGKVSTDKTIPYVTGAEFFGDRNPISYYQSVTALTLARTLGKKQEQAEKTLAMVDPIFAVDDARFAKETTEKRRAALDKLTGEKLMSFRTELKLQIPRLPLAEKLGESLKDADPAKTDLYEGLNAQKAVLLKSDLTPYRSCVLATHGYFGKDLPGIKEPVLILTLPNQPVGQDGFLRMSEVMGLKLNADMVALTACQSGLGRIVSGEGTMGMGRAFQYAGAKSVLMSLWSVAESSSVDLVTSFFKHVREGKNKLEAMKLAREDISKAGYDHPFFWAAFILVGEVD